MRRHSSYPPGNLAIKTTPLLSASGSDISLRCSSFNATKQMVSNATGYNACNCASAPCRTRIPARNSACNPLVPTRSATEPKNNIPIIPVPSRLPDTRLRFCRRAFPPAEYSIRMPQTIVLHMSYMGQRRDAKEAAAECRRRPCCGPDCLLSLLGQSELRRKVKSANHREW